MEPIKLIEGNFTADQARQVIGSLIDYKIQYHDRQNFSSEIRNGHSDEKSVSRLNYLRAAKENFDKAIGGGDTVEFVVNAEIIIKQK